jgi:hypothetical protein
METKVKIQAMATEDPTLDAKGGGLGQAAISQCLRRSR